MFLSTGNFIEIKMRQQLHQFVCVCISANPGKIDVRILSAHKRFSLDNAVIVLVCVCMFVLVCVGTVSACDSGVVEE